MKVRAVRVDLPTRLAIGAVAITAASLGLLSLAYGNFAPAENLPHWLPGRELCVRAAASILIAASVALSYSRTALASAMAVGAYQFIWVAIGVPAIVSAPFSIGSWYGSIEALTTLAGTVIVCVALHGSSRDPTMPFHGDRIVRAAQVTFGLTCVFYGCSHFAYAGYTSTMVPDWLPGRMGWAYFTGLAHIAAGLAIVIGYVPRLAATMEAIMMSLFGLLVWVPSFFIRPTPDWAQPPQNQWSELAVNVALAAAACVIALSFATRAQHLQRAP